MGPANLQHPMSYEMNELLDLEGGPRGYFFLHESQLLLAFLVTEIDLDKAAGNQSAADQ